MTARRKLDLATVQTMFVTIMPRIEMHAIIFFRNVRCPCKRDDLIAEAIGLSWKWFRKLVEQGKNPMLFVSAIATFAVKAVKSGRKVSGMEKSKGVMNPLNQ